MARRSNSSHETTSPHACLALLFGAQFIRQTPTELGAVLLSVLAHSHLPYCLCPVRGPGLALTQLRRSPLGWIGRELGHL